MMLVIEEESDGKLGSRVFLEAVETFSERRWQLGYVLTDEGEFTGKVMVSQKLPKPWK